MGLEHAKLINLWNDLHDKKHYYYADQLIALSLLHGGTGPNFFSKTLFNTITNGVEKTEVNELDVTDTDLLEVINIIKNKKDLNDLRLFIIENAITRIAGCTILHSTEDKEMLINSKFLVLGLYRYLIFYYRSAEISCNTPK